MRNTKGHKVEILENSRMLIFSLWSIQSDSSVTEEGNTHAKASLTRALKVAMRKSP